MDVCADVKRMRLLCLFAIAAVLWVSGMVYGDSMEEARRQALEKQRRIIINNDGGAIKSMRDEVSLEAFEKYFSGFEGTQVDTISYNTTASFGGCIHDSEVAEEFTTTVGRFRNNKVGKFMARGLDPLEIVVDYYHRQDIEVFWSMRMNDTHDADEPYMLPRLKQEHPEWLFGKRESGPRFCRWSAVDYGEAGVRDFAYRLIEEVCNKYDVDGVELDFFRSLGYFRCVGEGRHAGDVERGKMTGLIRRVRRMIGEVGQSRGRPILLAVRSPDSVGYCRAMGLDIEEWMREGLIDIWIASGFFRLNSWKYSVDLGHKYEVKVYAGMSETRILGEAGEIRDTAECYRGRAANAWYAGVDGLYYFNIFEPENRLWNEVGEPETLEGLDKIYTTAARSARHVGFWLINGRMFLNRRMLTPRHPASIKVGECESIPLMVGENLSGEKSENVRITVGLNVREMDELNLVSLKLKGKLTEGGVESNGWLKYDVEPKYLKRGVNEIEICVDGSANSRLTVQDLVMWVRYCNDR